MDFSFEQVSSILTMLALISILIIAHEFGHFWVAKKCGIRVERFGFGLPIGPTLWSKKFGETEYCVHAALFGGYVSFPDDDPDSEIPHDSPERFENKTVGQRFAVAVAGITVNAIMGWLIMVFVCMTWGIPKVDAVEIVEHADIGAGKTTPAMAAGILPKDEIVALNGDAVSNHKYNAMLFVMQTIGEHPGESLTLTVKRGEKTLNIPVVPTAKGQIGVRLAPGHVQYEKTANPLVAGSESFVFLSEFVVQNFQALGKMFTGQINTSELSGPIRIVEQGGKVIEKTGIQNGLILTAIISVILAVMNLLPIPALDGGHVLFLAIEALKGSPVKKEIQERAVQVGFMSLLLLMGFIVVNDVINIWFAPQEMPATAPNVEVNTPAPDPPAGR